MSKVKVVEALCGCGKSYWAIEHMKNNPDKKWIFVTPFLDEAGDDDSGKEGRVRKQAPELKFQIPSTEKHSTKSKHLLELMKKGENVSITHHLFMNIDENIIKQIEYHGYSLVIDETIEKVEVHQKSKQLYEDVVNLIQLGLITVSDRGKLEWNGAELNAYKEEYDLCKRGMLFLYKDRILIKKYSSVAYEVAEEVYVLTYMFYASPMRVWFQANEIEWEYIEPDLRISTKDRKEQVRQLIRIERQPASLHKYKRSRQTEFSKNWYDKNEGKLEELSGIATTLYERWKKRQKGVPPKIMFTCFIDYANAIAGKGCRSVDYSEPESGFVAKNARATNNHAHKDKILYWVNVYPQMTVKSYLDELVGEENGLDSDDFALSEMIQFIFRSAIREGKPIDIFIASDRMQELLEDWLEQES